MLMRNVSKNKHSLWNYFDDAIRSFRIKIRSNLSYIMEYMLTSYGYRIFKNVIHVVAKIWIFDFYGLISMLF